MTKFEEYDFPLIKGWIAFYEKEKLEIKLGEIKNGIAVNNLYLAKKHAIEHWTVPKSRYHEIALEVAY